MRKVYSLQSNADGLIGIYSNKKKIWDYLVKHHKGEFVELFSAHLQKPLIIKNYNAFNKEMKHYGCSLMIDNVEYRANQYWLE